MTSIHIPRRSGAVCMSVSIPRRSGAVCMYVSIPWCCVYIIRFNIATATGCRIMQLPRIMARIGLFSNVSRFMIIEKPPEYFPSLLCQLIMTLVATKRPRYMGDIDRTQLFCFHDFLNNRRKSLSFRQLLAHLWRSSLGRNIKRVMNPQPKDNRTRLTKMRWILDL